MSWHRTWPTQLSEVVVELLVAEVLAPPGLVADVVEYTGRLKMSVVEVWRTGLTLTLYFHSIKGPTTEEQPRLTC